MERQADALLHERPTTDTPEALVRRALGRLLPEGEPSVTRVAAAIHTSPRTLRRRLEARGFTFRALLEDARKRLAVRYLREPQLSLAEIAHLLGYSEQSAFTRAFRYWMNTTPKRWRSELAVREPLARTQHERGASRRERRLRRR
jgi:AraC-like DNA-binding protein